MKIPKIIHQTWKTKELPPAFAPLVASWKEQHPDWEFRLWTDDMNESFIRLHYPAFLPVYRSYPGNIQRADAVRYFLLMHFGGVYVDIDFECFRNMESLLQHAGFAAGEEPAEHCTVHGKTRIISNAFMASEKDHPFIRAVCEGLQHAGSDADGINDQILESTGPFMLTRMYEAFPGKADILIMKAQDIYPLTKDEIAVAVMADDVPQAIQAKLESAYAIHYYWGSWWR